MKGLELARAPGDLLGRRTSRSGSPEAGGGWPGAWQMERPRGSASCGAGTKEGVSAFRGEDGNGPRRVAKGLGTQRNR